MFFHGLERIGPVEVLTARDETRLQISKVNHAPGSRSKRSPRLSLTVEVSAGQRWSLARATHRCGESEMDLWDLWHEWNDLGLRESKYSLCDLWG